VWRQANKYGFPASASSTRWTASARTSSPRSPASKIACSRDGGHQRRSCGGNYKGVIDLLDIRPVWDNEELGAKWDVTDIPADLMEQAEEYRHLLVDVLRTTATDPREVHRRRGDHEPRLRDALRDATIAMQWCRAQRLGVQEQGVQPLLDAVVDTCLTDRPPAVPASIRRARRSCTARPTTRTLRRARLRS